MSNKTNTDNLKVDLRLAHKQFTFSQLRLLIDEKDRTVRTWLQRYFPEFGEKSSSGKNLFSVGEVIVMRIFSDLITKMGVQPEVAKLLMLKIVDRLEELSKMNRESAVDQSKITYNPLFLVILEIDKEGYSSTWLYREGISDLTEDLKPDPLLVVPVDSYYWDSIGKLMALLEHTHKIEQMKKKLKPMTLEELQKRSNEILTGHAE